MLNYRKINSIFEQSKYTKREVAKGCGFTRPTLDGLLQGADVKISTLEAWAKFFNKPISFFFDEDIISNLETHTSDHSGTSIYGDVSNVHNDNSCCDSKPDSNNNEKIVLLERQVTILESQIEDKNEIIRLLRDKENK